MNQIEYQNREDTYPEESVDNGPRIVILWDLLKVNTFAVINGDIMEKVLPFLRPVKLN